MEKKFSTGIYFCHSELDSESSIQAFLDSEPSSE
jgi:hypothetical protein